LLVLETGYDKIKIQNSLNTSWSATTLLGPQSKSCEQYGLLIREPFECYIKVLSLSENKNNNHSNNKSTLSYNRTLETTARHKHASERHDPSDATLQCNQSTLLSIFT